MSIYPSWRYHRNGSSTLVHNPDQEPQGPDWAESPFPPPPPSEKLNECCKKITAKFDEAWSRKLKECDDLKAELEALKAKRGKKAQA
jgi:hypothetical protein